MLQIEEVPDPENPEEGSPPKRQRGGGDDQDSADEQDERDFKKEGSATSSVIVLDPDQSSTQSVVTMDIPDEEMPITRAVSLSVR